ncbi:acetyl-CoA acetyltransferase [Marinobacterium marinum]|uniref:Acetyl-CoA acetyltransferase n=1 Tax=Marinobacterium marinum TaxID=2756129 RepID=A0A7W2AC19_9GAMM|nr:acetyl-CoA acetyltransferase [Marinobacterium marinum]MBA4501673.1 acetyl-CoA acetyltransferase [Marinobacterium marinum]
MHTYIIGTGHSRFGKLEQSLEELIAQVAIEALESSGTDPEEIDAVYIGHFNSGMCDQEFPASLVLNALPGLRFKPCTRVENACASGSAAIHQGINLIAGGLARKVLVIGAEKMTQADAKRIGKGLLGASYQPEAQGETAGFAGLFARIAQQYFDTHGDHSHELAKIAAKNHANGVHNPLAQFQKALDIDFCHTQSERNPVVSGPLKRTDCSPVSDGAAALVLAADNVSRAAPQRVRFLARAHTTDYMPMSKRNPLILEGATLAWKKVLCDADVTLDDLAFAEVHDCFTIAELMIYESMGLTPYGKGARALNEGWVYKDGRLPINPSGGLKSKGHPVGATGVSMHVMAARQLLEQAGGCQIPGARLGAVFNMGGLAVANYASILVRDSE